MGKTCEYRYGEVSGQLVLLEYFKLQAAVFHFRTKVLSENTINIGKPATAVYKTCNRTKPNRTYGNYRTYPTEPTEIIEHPDRTYGNNDLSIPGINCITC